MRGRRCLVLKTMWYSRFVSVLAKVIGPSRHRPFGAGSWWAASGPGAGAPGSFPGRLRGDIARLAHRRAVGAVTRRGTGAAGPRLERDPTGVGRIPPEREEGRRPAGAPRRDRRLPPYPPAAYPRLSLGGSSTYFINMII